ncbi:MAG: transglycosylase SLT domain-containing protein [Thermomicrobiales bacterium]|nr:transglycosylase SLT domain-containing protein [Thermomicrobiales bacterium]
METRCATPSRLIALIIALALICASSGMPAGAQDRYIPPANETVTATPTDAPTAEIARDDATVDAETTIVPGGAISAPAVDEAPKPQQNVRPRPDSRPVDFTAVTPEPTPIPTESPAGPVRLDEPVLRWLPEILLASEESGTPAHIIAGVMRLESGGNPNIISPVGARGLMQIMPSNLNAMGVPSSQWHDPETNIRAGGRFLASRAEIYGSWDQAVGAYFGFGCDVFGTCTDVYISVAFSWAEYYRPAIEDPLQSSFAVLPPDWTPPPINPFVEKAPEPVETPPSTPSATPTPSVTPTGEPGTTATPTALPTGEPTTAPTALPTEAPTEPPTAVPTEAPTEIPTDVPTEAPIEPPAESGTPPA